MSEDKHIVEVEVDGQTVKAYVRTPTRSDLSKADMQRAKKWNECMMEGGILTKKQLEDLLKDRGIWTEEEEKKQKKIVEEIGEMEKDLYLTSETRTIEQGKQLAVAIRKKRNELRELLAEKVAMEANTAESLADNVRFDYLVSVCLYDETNTQKIYKTPQEYDENADDPIAAAGAAKLAESLYGLDRSFEANLPENNWLTEYGLVNEELSMVNADGDLVDLEGRRINDVGQYVDEKGNPIDKDGNPLDEHGNYVFDKSKYQADAPKKKGRPKKTASGVE